MRPDPVLAPVMDGPHLEVARLERPEVPLHGRQALVGEDHARCVELAGRHARADDVEPVEGGLRGDRSSRRS